MASSPQEAPNSLLSNSYLKIIDLLGEGIISGWVVQSGAYGNDPLVSTYYDNVPVRNLDGSYNFNVSGQGYNFYYTLGTTGQTPMSGFEKVENVIPLSSNTQITNPPIGAGNIKNVTTTFNTQMYPDANSIRVTTEIPAIYAQGTDGSVNPTTVSYAIDISLNGGSFVTVDTISLTGKCTSPYLHSTTYTLPKTTPPSAFYQWTVRIRKTSVDILAITVPNAIFVNSIAVISASQFNYPNSALVGTLIAADQFSAVPNRAYLMNGILVNVPNGYNPTTYPPTGGIIPATYPNVWLGDWKSGVWTDNPAWIFNDILTNSRYGLGDYIQQQYVDKWSLYQIAQYCDQLVDNGQNNSGFEPRFTCNVNITQAEDAYNVLLNLSSAFRGMIYYANGSVYATQTSDKQPVFNYTNANVIKGQFSYADSARNTRATVAKVRWNDPNNLYRENTSYVEDPLGIIRYGYLEKDIAAFACTSPGQAMRLGQWVLTTERLLTETISFQVGLDSLYLKPGDVFNVYDNFRNNQSQGGRIVSFDSTRTQITIDRPISLGSGYSYAFSAIVPKFTLDGTGSITGSDQTGLIHNSQIETYPVTNAAQSGVTVISLQAPFSTGLYPGSPWIISATGNGNVFATASIYQCLSVAEVEPGIMEVLGLQYNTGINYYVENRYNVVPVPINSGDPSPLIAPSNFVIALATGQTANNDYYSYLRLTWQPSPSTNLDHYIVSGQQPGGPVWGIVANTRATGCSFIPSAAGQANFQLAAVSNGGVFSPFVSGNYNVAGPTTLSLSGIRFWELPVAFGEQDQIGVFYNRPDPSVTNTIVYYGGSSNAAFTGVFDTDFYCAQGSIESGLSNTGLWAHFKCNAYDMPRMISQGVQDQANNQLLLLVDNELMSVGAVSGQGGGIYDLNVLRGVMGTFSGAHSISTSGYLFYQSELTAFSHPDLYNVYTGARIYSATKATKYFQIQNKTPFINGTQLPVGGIAYTLPNPAPDAPSQLTAQVGTGKIVRLDWVAPQDFDVIYYNIYRATGPAFSDRALIGADVNGHYNDISVTLGTTYQYWVTSVSNTEIESALSASVTATPQFLLPSGVNTNNPADAAAITISSSGTYFTQDGTLLSFLGVTVPAMASGAAYQNILIRKHAVGTLSGSTVIAQPSNSSSITVTIPDLSPNIVYDLGSQSISNFGLTSYNITTATNSPFTAPTGIVPPAQPTNLSASGGALNGIALQWDANIEVDIQEYGIYRNTTSSVTLANLVANAASNHYIDAYAVIGVKYWYAVSAIDWSDNISPLSATITAAAQAISTGNLNAPANPTAPTLILSGTDYANDGSLLAYLTFSMSSLSSGAAYQNLIYRKTNTANAYLPAAQSTGAGNQTIFDLTPGISYDVAIQAVSNYDILSNIVTAIGSPFIGPKTSTTPATPTNLVASGGIYGIAHDIYLSWTANSEVDFEEYGIYRNTTNSAPATPYAFAAANFFVDAAVTGGQKYFYWVSAYNRSEVQSALTSSVSAITLGPPSDSVAPTLTLSGAIGPTSDGNVFSYLTFNIFALPVGAIGQQLMYRPSVNASSYTISDDISNYGTVLSTINDLSPGVSYDVAIRPYTINGMTGAVTAAIGSPFVAPSKNTAPGNPTGVVLTIPTAGAVPPKYTSTNFNSADPNFNAVIINWQASTSTNVAYYEIFISSPNTLSPTKPPPYYSPAQLGYLDHVSYTVCPKDVTGAYLYISDSEKGQTVYVRAVDRNGNFSSPANGPIASAFCSKNYAGNAGAQNNDDMRSLGLRVGNDTTNTSIRQVLADYVVNAVYSTTGGSSLDVFCVSLTGRGFNVAPDTASFMNLSDYSNRRFYYDSASSTSTVARIVIATIDNTNMPAANGYRYGVDFIEYT